MDPERVIAFSGAEILEDGDSRCPPIFFPRLRTAASPLVALDIGGTLIKLAYTASCANGSDGTELRFTTFDKDQLDDCFEFLRAEGLISGKGTRSSNENVVLKATGAGAYKFANDFQGGLDVYLDKLYEFETIVSGVNFLLKNVAGAAYTHMDGKMSMIDVCPTKLFPYLIVNIGSGVSMIKVTGNKNFEFVTGTHIGGAFVFGLAKLLTGCRSYEEFLQLCQKGDNCILDSFVKDICGELVSQQQGNSASTRASSFAKVITSKKKLADYKSEDLASALLCIFTYNIAHIAFLVATLLGLEKVIFAGSFICGHKSTMETISSAIDVWSKSHIKVIFLRHEGYLGAIGALMSNFDSIEENLMCNELAEWAKPSLDECMEPLHKTPAFQTKDSDIFPYLFVSIGSGVSMTEVSGKGRFKAITGSPLGGGTILGLAMLLTGCSSYEEFLVLSKKGNNLSIDLTIEDTFGESSHKCGIPESLVVGSFGKVHSSKHSEYKVEDISASLLNCFIYNTGQVVYLVTKILGLKRVLFHGAFVCDNENIMNEMSHFLEHRLKSEAQVTFVQREGFLEPLGASLSYEDLCIDSFVGHADNRDVFSGASYSGQFSTTEDWCYD